MAQLPGVGKAVPPSVDRSGAVVWHQASRCSNREGESEMIALDDRNLCSGHMVNPSRSAEGSAPGSVDCLPVRTQSLLEGSASCSPRIRRTPHRRGEALPTPTRHPRPAHTHRVRDTPTGRYCGLTRPPGRVNRSPGRPGPTPRSETVTTGERGLQERAGLDRLGRREVSSQAEPQRVPLLYPRAASTAASAVQHAAPASLVDKLRGVVQAFAMKRSGVRIPQAPLSRHRG